MLDETVLQLRDPLMSAWEIALTEEGRQIPVIIAATLAVPRPELTRLSGKTPKVGGWWHCVSDPIRITCRDSVGASQANATKATDRR